MLQRLIKIHQEIVNSGVYKKGAVAGKVTVGNKVLLWEIDNNKLLQLRDRENKVNIAICDSNSIKFTNRDYYRYVYSADDDIGALYGVRYEKDSDMSFIHCEDIFVYASIQKMPA